MPEETHQQPDEKPQTNQNVVCSENDINIILMDRPDNTHQELVQEHQQHDCNNPENDVGKRILY